jgi:AraC-like DNA-binding protein
MSSDLPGAYLSHLVDLTGRWGVAEHAVLEGSGIDAEALRAPTCRVPTSTFSAVASRAMALTGERGLGVYYGMQTQITWHGFLGFAVMSSETLDEAIELVVRYSPTRASQVAWRRGTEDELSFLELVEIEPLGDLRDFVVSWLLTSAALMAAQLVDRPVTGHAEVSFDQRPHHESLVRYMPGPVQFGRPRDRLVFATSFLRLPVIGADRTAHHQTLAQCERELVTHGNAGQLAARVIALLPRAGGGFRSLEELAAELTVSPRTLRRQLESAGTSYGAVLDRLRRSRALELIDDPARSIESIAIELGYSDAANFTRAFRRWTGASPTEHRRR